MKLFLLRYKLNSPGQQHRELASFLDEKYPDSLRLTDATYLIPTAFADVYSIKISLSDFLDKNDELFLAELKGDAEICFQGQGEDVLKAMRSIFKGRNLCED